MKTEEINGIHAAIIELKKAVDTLEKRAFDHGFCNGDSEIEAHLNARSAVDLHVMRIIDRLVILDKKLAPTT